jgi:hypothetical protein
VIKTTTCIHAACDICGAIPENDMTDGYSHFEPGQESDALSEAESQDWWTDRDSHLVLCDKRDEAHLAKARQIHGVLKSADDPELDTFLTYWPELDEEHRSHGELVKAAYRSAASGSGSADDDAPTCRDCDTWPCSRHATDADRAEYERATGNAESGSAAK